MVQFDGVCQIGGGYPPSRMSMDCSGARKTPNKNAVCIPKDQWNWILTYMTG